MRGPCKGVYLSDEDYNFINRLQDNGLNFSRFIRLLIKTLREQDEKTLEDLTHYVRTTPDILLKYDSREKQTEDDIEWRHMYSYNKPEKTR